MWITVKIEHTPPKRRQCFIFDAVSGCLVTTLISIDFTWCDGEKDGGVSEIKKIRHAKREKLEIEGTTIHADYDL